MPSRHSTLCTLWGVLLLPVADVKKAKTAIAPVVDADTRRSIEAAWSTSPYVDEIDGEDGGLDAAIRVRHGFSPPLVIRGIEKDNKDLMSWGDLRDIASGQTSGAPNKFKFDGVKVSNHPVAAAWKTDINWMRAVKVPNPHQRDPGLKVRSWHSWKVKSVPYKRFSSNFEKPGKPYHYWMQNLPDIAVRESRESMCSKFAPAVAGCTKERSLGWQLWASSVGVTAQAHYDADSTVYVQVYGRKKFTFWQPADISRLCITPRAYPGDCQSQIDMDDEGERTPYNTSCRHALAHNRSVVIVPGDVLLFPSYYAHRVEALDAAISMAFIYGEESDGEGKVTTPLFAAITHAIASNTSTASAVLRVLSRRVAAAILASPALPEREQWNSSMRDFMQDSWKNWQMLPDHDKLGVATPEQVSVLCTEEAALSPKVMAWIDKKAKVISKKALKWAHPSLLHKSVDHVISISLMTLQGLIKSEVYSKPLLKLSDTHTWFTAVWQCHADAAVTCKHGEGGTCHSDGSGA